MSQTLGQRIQKYRKAAKLTQRQLSLRCGWGSNQSRVGNYEADAREPSLADIDKMAEALGVGRAQLLLDAVLSSGNTSANPDPVAPVTLLTDEAMLLESYRAAGKEAKNFALTALINGYTARPSPSVASPHDIFVGLLDMDVDAYFDQPEQERRRIALEVGEKVVNILDPRKRTRDPAEVGRTYQRKDDPPELRAKQGK